MSLKFEFVLPGYGRSISDDKWEFVDPAQITVWEAAIDTFSSRTLTIKGVDVAISADWKPVLSKHKQHYLAMQKIMGAPIHERAGVLNKDPFPREEAIVAIEANLTCDDGGRDQLASSAVELYLYDFFLVLNICSPGCCEFYRAKLLQDGCRFPTELSLSNVHFEVALLGSFEKEWPQLSPLVLPQVIDWFEAVRSGVSQTPKNQMEKVLFALLHISRLDLDPMIVIWIFYSFESLLQTRTGENFSTIVRRLGALLGLTTGQATVLKRKLRELYDIRSGIVHGGFEVLHPMHNYYLDEQVDESYGRLQSAVDYALTTLIAAIQKTIAMQWRYPTFQESICGAPLLGAARETAQTA